MRCDRQAEEDSDNRWALFGIFHRHYLVADELGQDGLSFSDVLCDLFVNPRTNSLLNQCLQQITNVM